MNISILRHKFLSIYLSLSMHIFSPILSSVPMRPVFSKQLLLYRLVSPFSSPIIQLPSSSIKNKIKIRMMAAWFRKTLLLSI